MENITKFAFITDKKGATDLKLKNIFELKEMLERQNHLLAKKSVINNLKDKGEKIRKVRDEIAVEINLRQNNDTCSTDVKNNSVFEWKKKAVKSSKKHNVETDENNVLKILSENGQIPRKQTHMQRLIDKEKSPSFNFKPNNPVVAPKVKNVVPEAHTGTEMGAAVKPIHLDESLNLLTDQMSALKILGSTSRKKRAKECIEDRLNESVCEEAENDLENEEESTDEPEFKSAFTISVTVSSCN